MTVQTPVLDPVLDAMTSRGLLGSRCTAAMLLVTFVLALVKDLTFGIVAGCVLAALFALFKRPVPEEGE
jgi:SulP family sulfate permease